jgi:hypothetical protein
MKMTKTLIASAALAAALAGAPLAHAGEDVNPNAFVKMCDTDKDGMVSKAEAMKMIEKMFDKRDTKKMGKLDKKQVELFLTDLTKMTGG